MLTYQNDPKFKKAFVAEAVKHEKADSFLQGTYGMQNGHWRGCSVACSLRSLDKLQGKPLDVYYDDHSRFERDGLWPEWLARLQDTIFEGLPQEDAIKWTAKLARAVPVGVDITPVKYKFCAYLMRENIERVLSLNISEELKSQVVDAIRQVLALHESAIKTGEWDESAAWSAAESAWSAAESAWSAAASAESAWSAAESAWSAAASAESAWSAARSAAGSAEWSAARSAAGSAAWSAAYQRHSKGLLRLLKEAA